ncbi:hypothetical protein ACH4SP_41585 [Streptomyces sp. NPDC021093]|uniref:hypothetical protein n=1 Tax=Streptomyces sp. NPDC021093 TaxID=3365112 RepID=UPI0037B3F76B
MATTHPAAPSRECDGVRDSGLRTGVGHGPGETARNCPRQRVTAPDLVLCGILCFLCCVAWRLPWAGDLGQHAAVIDRLRHDLADPGSPLVDRPGSGSPYYTPYTVAAALLARATGAASLSVMSVCGMVNSLALLAGLRIFVRTLTDRLWAPALTALCMLFLWGTQLFLWSGHASLSALCLSLSYPSLFAFALGLYLWSRLLRAGREDTGVVHWAVTGLLAGCLVLIHPVMAMGALIGCSAMFAGTVRRIGPRTLARCTAGAVTAALLLVVWPYGNILSLPDASALDAFHISAYELIPQHYGLALIGLPVLLLRLRRSRRDPLVLMCLGTATVAVCGWFTGHYTWGRVIPHLLFGLQCAPAVELCAPWPRGVRARTGRGLLAAVFAVALLNGARVQAGALLYVVPAHRLPVAFTAKAQYLPTWPGFDWAARHFRYGEVVLTNDYEALRMLPGYGVYTVMPAWPQPEIPRSESMRRTADVALALDARATGSERRKAVCRGGADWLVLTGGQSIPPGQGFVETAEGPDGVRLVRVALRC